MIFPDVFKGCARCSHPLHDMRLKWPKPSGLLGTMDEQVVVQYFGSASLLDIASGTAHSLRLSPGCPVAWASWCSQIHIAVLLVPDGIQGPSQQQLCILDSKRLLEIPRITLHHIAARHAFVTRRDWLHQKAMDHAWQTGWPASCVAQNADSIILPSEHSTVFICSLPALEKGSRLICPAMKETMPEPQGAAWSCQGLAVVEWMTPVPYRAFSITIHMPNDGSIVYGISMPVAGSSWYISECLLSTHQPYLAVRVCTESVQLVQLLDVSAKSRISIPSQGCGCIPSMCWSSSGKYLVVTEQQPHTDRGHLRILSAPSGEVVYYESTRARSCHDILCGPDGDYEACLLDPGSRFSPDMLIMSKAQPAFFLWLRQASMPGGFHVTRRWSFAPNNMLLVSLIDDPYQEDWRNSAPILWRCDQQVQQTSIVLPLKITGLDEQPVHFSNIAWRPTLKMQSVFAAVSKNHGIIIVDARTGKVLSCTSLYGNLEHDHGMVDHLQWSADGSKLSICSDNGQLWLLDFAPRAVETSQ